MKRDDERRKKRTIGSFKKGREVEVICFFGERCEDRDNNLQRGML